MIKKQMFVDELISVYVRYYKERNREKLLKGLRVVAQHVKKVPYERVISEILELSEKERSLFVAYANRFLSGEPLSKIFHTKAFWNDDFYVDTHVLDPRPETEFIIETVLSLCPLDGLEFLDIGVGSGAILLSLLKEYPKSVGTGIDISREAVEVAKRNQKALKVKNATLLNVSLEDYVKGVHVLADVVVSNPPYIPTDEMILLEVGVRKYDPKIALDGGPTGLYFYEKISEFARKLTKRYIIVEIGYGQLQDVTGIFEQRGLKITKVVQDLSGIDRVVVAEI